MSSHLEDQNKEVADVDVESQYSDIDPSAELGGATQKVLHVFNKIGFSTDRTITDDSPEQTPLYFLEFNRLSSPYAILHSGPEKKGPVIGEMTKKTFGNHYEFSIGGGPEQTLDTTGLFSKSKHVWTVKGRQDLNLEWRRTRGKEVKEQGGSSLGGLNLKLVDTNTNEVIALFVHQKFSRKKFGRFFLNTAWYDKFGPGWEEAVVLSGLSLIQQQIRRNSSAAAGGAGGGGAC